MSSFCFRVKDTTSNYVISGACSLTQLPKMLRQPCSVATRHFLKILVATPQDALSTYRFMRIEWSPFHPSRHLIISPLTLNRGNCARAIAPLKSVKRKKSVAMTNTCTSRSMNNLVHKLGNPYRPRRCRAALPRRRTS